MVFPASIDGAGGMRDIGPSCFRILENGSEKARGDFSGTTFAQEKATIIVELYRRGGEWRITSVLQGFNEGLAALVSHFGGTVAEPAPAPAPEPPKPAISLEKKIAQAAPQLVSLAKKAQVSLEKHRLTGVKARVALVLDASGSMHSQYSSGRVQEVVNRLLPQAVHFDDNGSLDCWAFGDDPLQLSDISLGNYASFIARDHGGWRDWEVGSRINNEPAVMKQVIAFYEGTRSRLPVYVLFISDGGVRADGPISKLMIKASSLPIFWQFVGLGGSNYGVLEKLDGMKGRVVDNCNFFALDDLRDISEEALYERLMKEFPGWLKVARGAGIIG
jgi:hypothetical protein